MKREGERCGGQLYRPGFWETDDADDALDIRCTRKKGHEGPHRGPVEFYDFPEDL